MSILKNILSPFFEFKEQKPGPGKESQLQPTETRKESVNEGGKIPATVSPVNNPPSYAPVNSAGASKTSSDEYEKHFTDLIEEANAKNPLFQGTDLKEFIDSKVDVESIADEGTRYKTAFNVLKRTGLTKEKLVITGKEYINIVENDLKGFEKAFTQQYRIDVEQMEQKLQEKIVELKTLNEKIATLNQEIKQISDSVAQNKDRLNSNKNAFIKAGEDKKKELQAELEKINQYFL